MFQNFFVLSLVQAVRLLVPILVIPLLARSISQQDFGIYMYAISFSAWVSMFVEYGFSISSTRQIASSASAIDVVAGTQSARLLLCVATIPILLLGAVFFPMFKSQSLWATAGWLIGILTGLSPIYYFQGKERLKIVALAEIISAAVLISGVFLFVRKETDARVLPYVLVISRATSLILLTAALIKDTGLKIRHIRINQGIKFIKKDFDFFFFVAAASLYTSFNVVFLGFFCGPVQVGAYASAERMLRAGLAFIGQATNAVFPRLNSVKVNQPHLLERKRMKLLCMMLLLGISGLIVTYLISPYVAAYFFGSRVLGVEKLMKIMAMLIPAIALSNTFGFHFLIVDKKERLFNKIIIGCALLNVPVSFLWVQSFKDVGMAYSWVMIEWVIAMVLGFFVIRENKKII